MRVMSYNTLFGGLDGADDGRYQLQIGIIREQRPDALLLQEAKGFSADGSRRLFETERYLGMRGFVADAPTTGQNTAIFIRPELQALHFDADFQHFHHAAALLKLAVSGNDRALTVASVHLCPNSPHVRAREASYLYNLADPDGLSLIGGDFNSVSPDDPEPDGLSELPAYYCVRYTGEDGTADRSTISALLRAGFIDVGHELSRRQRPLYLVGVSSIQSSFRSAQTTSSPARRLPVAPSLTPSSSTIRPISRRTTIRSAQILR